MATLFPHRAWQFDSPQGTNDGSGSCMFHGPGLNIILHRMVRSRGTICHKRPRTCTCHRGRWTGTNRVCEQVLRGRQQIHLSIHCVRVFDGEFFELVGFGGKKKSFLLLRVEGELCGRVPGYDYLMKWRNVRLICIIDYWHTGLWQLGMMGWNRVELEKWVIESEWLVRGGAGKKVVEVNRATTLTGEILKLESWFSTQRLGKS